ncbi:hypothetical protein L3X38_008110 [Prunus dulcis]|uniref:Uncharacterized protein n=1 Tax=Prunus dulcis TaxID=3755 RepID=A0AAD4ZVV5_PRUDU|nr:hypothetical protein L3X38_008110 [Prunus dulcis]
MVQSDLPLIDLRLLSQSDLYSLSLTSSSSLSNPTRRFDDDVLIPKIDRSVFNESAGSRKQTYSRLHLAPCNSQFPIPNPKSQPTPFSHSQSRDPETCQIISLLKQLFPSSEKAENDDVLGKRKRGRPRKDENRVVSVSERERNSNVKESSVTEERVKVEEAEMVMVNENGVVLDLAALGNADDSFGEALRRRTDGLETEAQLLGFLGGLEGGWSSARKKRKIVQASELLDAFSRQWKTIHKDYNKMVQLHLFVDFEIETRGLFVQPVYVYRSYEQHRMLTDFEGATRKNEVGFCIWTSKEFHQCQLWATNEVCARSKFWYFLRKLKKVKKSNGQVLAINEVGKWFLLNSPPGLIQFVAKGDMKQKQLRKSHMKWVFYVGVRVVVKDGIKA